MKNGIAVLRSRNNCAKDNNNNKENVYSAPSSKLNGIAVSRSRNNCVKDNNNNK